MAINYPRLTAAQLVKMRFKKQKEQATVAGINQSTFREFVFDKEPAYNTAEGWDRIRTAWGGRSADLRLLELLSEMQLILMLKKQAAEQ